MELNKNHYKKQIRLIKQMKKLDNIEKLSSVLELCYHKIKSEREFREVGTDLTNFIVESKILKTIKIRFNDGKSALLTFVQTSYFETGLALVSELFNDNKIQYGFYIYDTSRSITND